MQGRLWGRPLTPLQQHLLPTTLLGLWRFLYTIWLYEQNETDSWQKTRGLRTVMDLIFL